MSSGQERHMFPGGNTSKGFFSYYDFILPQEKASRILILKGGPGVGKSTFMKEIAKTMLSKGYDIEYMHCSSDPESLDGIVIPQKNIALMDGTAPHIIDPKNPGAVDEIINLGEFWSENDISRHRDKILLINKVISGAFSRAYRYIKAAYSIYEDNTAIYNLCTDYGKVNLIIAEMIREIFGDIRVSAYEGEKRCLFASAITPNGLVNFLPTLLKTKKVIIIKGKPGTGTEKILERIRLAAVERGLFTESFYCALNPHKLEHLIIPELQISLTTSNIYHKTISEPLESTVLDSYPDESFINKPQEAIRPESNPDESDLRKPRDTNNPEPFPDETSYGKSHELTDFNSYSDESPRSKPREVISFDSFLNESALDKYLGVIDFNRHEFDRLLDRAIQTIKRAKEYHDELESYYIPSMNFSEVEKCQEAILQRILQ